MATAVEEEPVTKQALPTGGRFRAAKFNDGGPLAGFNDEQTKSFRPMQVPVLEPAPVGSPTPELESDQVHAPTVNAGSEPAIAQQLRAQKIAAQRKFESEDRVRQWKRVIQGQKAKQIAAVRFNESEQARADYKLGWQIRQEVAEITALSLADFFLISGPVTVGLYFLRWVVGNMMGEMFTDNVDLLGVGAVSRQRIPGYSLSDPLDYIRHWKFMMIGFFTIIIYGFMSIILYYIFHPAALTKLGWPAFSALIQLFIKK